MSYSLTNSMAKKSKTRAVPPRVYQLKISLMETGPPIWRRLRVPGSTTLSRLDRIIQTAMGWTNSHLHTFTAGGVLYSDPDPEWEIDVRDERRVRLGQIATEEGEAFVYEYDLGDSWRYGSYTMPQSRSSSLQPR